MLLVSEGGFTMTLVKIGVDLEKFLKNAACVEYQKKYSGVF
jgi:hypothetical protein